MNIIIFAQTLNVQLQSVKPWSMKAFPWQCYRLLVNMWLVEGRSFEIWYLKSLIYFLRRWKRGVFWNKVSRSGRNCIGYNDQRPVSTVMCTSNNLDGTIIMRVLVAADQAFKPVVIFLGKHPHYREISSGKVQTVHDLFPHFYVHYRPRKCWHFNISRLGF